MAGLYCRSGLEEGGPGVRCGPIGQAAGSNLHEGDGLLGYSLRMPSRDVALTADRRLLGDDVLDDGAADVRQSHVATAMVIGELFVVHS